MNLYRGCTHGCIYCDSRSKCYGMLHDFEDIEVKSDAVGMLKIELSKKRQKCTIGTGAMTDPYLPLEEELQYTRQCLELIDQHRFGLSIHTKSDLILRDIDLLERINEHSKCVVQITLTTADEELCRVLEPRVCTTERRVQVLSEMQKRGIPTVVWLTPILPFINDNEMNITRLIEYCAQTQVKAILNYGMGLTLREGNREYYYSKLDESFPGLKKEYQKRYLDSYHVLSPNYQKLMQVFQQQCQKYGILTDINSIFGYLWAYQNKQEVEQLYIPL